MSESSHPAPPAQPGAGSAAIIQRARACLLQNYRQQPLALVRGEGVYVWDADGRRYLDFIAGIATCALGHCHPTVVAAAKAQLDRLWHVSNAFFTEPQVALAERLCAASGLPGARAFFCNSGAEANEALIKLARRWHKGRAQSERYEIITFEQSFHGRTLGTLTATGQAKYHQGFEPLPVGFRYVPFGNIEAVAEAVSGQTAAVLVEPIQGEGGVRSAPAGFLRALRRLCTGEGLLLLLDEVQTGSGRTGRTFAYQHEDVLPDAFSLAKALGNGLPIGAMVCSEAVAEALPAGTHGSTFGGNPVVAAAACAAWDLATSPAMLARVATSGRLLDESAQAMRARRPDRIVEARGRGLLYGVEVTGSASEVVGRCRDHGLLVNLAGEKTVRFAPSFLIDEAQLLEGLALFERSL